MQQKLENTVSESPKFTMTVPFIAFLAVYQDNWFIEYAINADTIAAADWKRWHNQPIQEHGELSRVLVHGSEGLAFRFRNSNDDSGATGYVYPVPIRLG